MMQPKSKCRHWGFEIAAIALGSISAVAILGAGISESRFILNVSFISGLLGAAFAYFALYLFRMERADRFNVDEHDEHQHGASEPAAKSGNSSTASVN